MLQDCKVTVTSSVTLHPARRPRTLINQKTTHEFMSGFYTKAISLFYLESKTSSKLLNVVS